MPYLSSVRAATALLPRSSCCVQNKNYLESMGKYKSVCADTYGLDLEKHEDYGDAKKLHIALTVAAAEMHIVDAAKTISSKNVKHVKSIVNKNLETVMKAGGLSSDFQAGIGKEVHRINKM